MVELKGNKDQALKTKNKNTDSHLLLVVVFANFLVFPTLSTLETQFFSGVQ